MAEIRYLTLADVLALHQAIMERFGLASAPLRDEGSLESAVMRPRMAAYYSEPKIVCIGFPTFVVMRPRMAAYYSEADILRQSALLAVSISQAQDRKSVV